MYQVHWSLSVSQIQAVVKKYDILFIADEVCAYLIEPMFTIITPKSIKKKRYR